MIYHVTWYPYDAKTIKENVPPTSGVYSLFSHQSCVYVGTSKELQADLLRSLNGESTNPCISQHVPDEFVFEVAMGDDRNTRRDELIAEYNPACRD